MLSLQSVHVEQFLPQGGQMPVPQAEQRPADADAASFLDLLRAEQRADGGQDAVSRVSDGQTNPQAQEESRVAEHADDGAVRAASPRDEKPRVAQETDEDGQEPAEADVQPAVAAVLPAMPLVAQPSQPVAEADVAEEPVFGVQVRGAEEDSAAVRFAAGARSAQTDAVAVADDGTTVPHSDEDALALLNLTEQNDGTFAPAQETDTAPPVLFAQAAGTAVAEDVGRADMPSADGAKKGVPGTKDRPRIAVTDLRTRNADEPTETDRAVGRAQQKNGADLAFAQKGEPSVQMTVDMIGAADAGRNITSASTQTAAAQGSNFQAMLANAVQEHAPDFVRAGSIILRDGNQGAINVILRPESLGNVKISLSLSDKVISGQITVQSQEAYDAFRDSIDTLKAAFAQGGFEAQGFDLNFAGGQQFAQSRQDGWQNPGSAVRADRSYGDLVADGPEAEAAGYVVSDYGVNIVA